MKTVVVHVKQGCHVHVILVKCLLVRNKSTGGLSVERNVSDTDSH